VVGAQDLEASRTALEQATRLAPEFERAGSSGPIPQEPAVPLDQKTWAPVSFATFGYHLTSGDEPTCQGAAGLLELRLTREVVVKRPLASRAAAECLTLRGHRFLVASVFTSSFEATDLPDVLRQSFTGLSNEPAAAEELQAVAHHDQCAQEELWDHPEILADLLALGEVGEHTGETLERYLAPANIRSQEVKAFASRNFNPDQEVQVLFSPFQQSP
jgi:hypothetical protein